MLFVGCATSKLTTEKVMADGTRTNYTVTINSLFQDFAGSDLSATLNSDGKTMVKAGAVDNKTNTAAADAMKELVGLIKEMLPYIVKTAPAVVVP